MYWIAPDKNKSQALIEQLAGMISALTAEGSLDNKEQNNE